MTRHLYHFCDITETVVSPLWPNMSSSLAQVCHTDEKILLLGNEPSLSLSFNRMDRYWTRHRPQKDDMCWDPSAYPLTCDKDDQELWNLPLSTPFTAVPWYWLDVLYTLPRSFLRWDDRQEVWHNRHLTTIVAHNGSGIHSRQVSPTMDHARVPN